MKKDPLSDSNRLEMFNRIREWAGSKGIYQEGDLKTQTLKLLEESGELAKAVLHDDKEEIIDAIGDCVVVLTNVAQLASIHFNVPFDPKDHFIIEDCVQSAYDVIKNRTGEMKDGNFVKDN